MERTYSGAAAIVVVVFIACVIMLLPREAEAEEIDTVATYYGFESGTVTASGEAFDPWGMTVAHPWLPLGTHITVCHEGCQDAVVNDRGPFGGGASIDLSMGVAQSVGLLDEGVGEVEIYY